MDNPFTEATVDGEFGKIGTADRVHVDGFCDSLDGSIFRIRFMPSSAGDYSYSVVYRQGDFEKMHTGEFQVVDGNRRGILKVDPENPWHFIWEGTDEHYFWNGTTTWAHEQQTPEQKLRSSAMLSVPSLYSFS